MENHSTYNQQHIKMNFSSPYIKLRQIILLLLLITWAPLGVAQTTPTWDHADLSNKVTRQLKENCMGLQPLKCKTATEKLILEVNFSTGETHELGDLPFSTSVAFRLRGHLANGQVWVVWKGALELGPDQPEQVMRTDVTAMCNTVAYYELSIVNYQEATGQHQQAVWDAVRLQMKASHEKKVKVDPVFSFVTLDQVNIAPGSAKVEFKWNQNGCPAPGYQVQIMRLFNIGSTYNDNINTVNAKIDWSRALTLETENDATSLTLILSEGRGLYTWRVRPIGNFYEGGIGNPNNWGAWNPGSPPQDLSIQTFSAAPPAIFFYDQFDEQRNFIHNRIFTEGNKMREAVTYANGLQQVKQNQVLLHSLHEGNGEVLVTQTVQDFIGRPAVQTLPAPVNGQNCFGYVDEFVLDNAGKLYRAASFDQDGQLPNPADAIAMSSGTPLTDYYSDISPEPMVPDAEGYPFTRTVFFNDGTERVKEQSNVGATLTMGKGHTSKTVYVSTSDQELVSLFGDEAPAKENVQKVVNIDPNGTASVSYVEKQGQTIATCLASVKDENAYPRSLGSAPEFGTPVTETLTKRLSAGAWGSKASKRLYFVTPTTLSIDYNLTQEDILVQCGNFCMSCDYVVDFRIQSLDQDIAPFTRSVPVLPQTMPDCSGNDPLITDPQFTFQYAGPNGNGLQGEWLVEMTVSTRNDNPQTGFAYIREAKAELGLQLKNEIGQLLDPITGPGGALYASGPEPDFEALNTYLDDNNYDFDSDLNEWIIPMTNGCDALRLPRLEPCEPEYSCDPAPDFEAFLLQQYHPLGYSASAYDYFFTKKAPTYGLAVRVIPIGHLNSGIAHVELLLDGNYILDQSINLGSDPAVDIAAEINASSTIYEAIAEGNEVWLMSSAEVASELAGLLELEINGNLEFSSTGPAQYRPDPNAPAEPFNLLIQNMLADGYTCDQLWECWTSVVSLWDVLAFDAQGNPTDFDLLQTFLACTGKRYEGVSNCRYGNCGYGQGYLSHAHRYFRMKLGEKSDCEAEFNVPSIIPGQPYSYSWWMADDPTPFSQLVEQLPDPNDPSPLATSGEKRWEMLYHCVSNLTNTIPGNLTLSQWMQQTSNDMEGECVSLCASRAVEFGSTLVQYLLNNGYTATYDPAGQLTGYLHTTNSNVIPLANLECLVIEFENNCLSGCIMTPQPVGGPFTSPATTAQLEYFRLLLTGIIEVTFPDGDIYDSGSRCPDDGPAWQHLGDETQDCGVYVCYYIKPFDPEDIPQEEVFIVDYEDCNRESANYLDYVVKQQTDDLIAAAQGDLEEQYRNTCSRPADVFTIGYELAYHHYTLYYYDRAGNLVQTVSPEGVQDLAPGTTRANAVVTHNLRTKYQYNSLRQLRSQETPDGGQTNFIYDSIGQLRFSQNARQAAGTDAYGNPKAFEYAYTKYDRLGRIIEVGKAEMGSDPFDALEVDKDDPAFPTNGSERIQTFYSKKAPGVNYLDGRAQRHLRNRVSYTVRESKPLPGGSPAITSTYYSYDPHGNVEWLVQDIPGLDRQYLRYEYDLYSGNVNQVFFNEGGADRFMHRYTYDEDNRIQEVYTSTDGVIWDKDAQYKYYLHGPLKRAQIGEDQVQGSDYLYTIHGWLKGINHPDRQTDHDPGRDGLLHGPNINVAQDVFGMSLHYFDDDYRRTGSYFQTGDAGMPDPEKPLFNGNIAAWATHLQENPDAHPLHLEQLTAYQYRYDELNRIKTGLFKYWDGQDYADTDDYQVSFSYDANGNLDTLIRNGYAAGQLMDKLIYSYPEDGNQQKLKNRLTAILDEQPISTGFDDIHTGPTPDAFAYDEIGNLTEDEHSGNRIFWNLLNKVDRLEKWDPADQAQTVFEVLKFEYDANGNRVAKLVYLPDNNAPGGYLLRSATYYVRDASGNVMGIFTKEPDATTDPELYEVPLYGSSRIGVYRPCKEQDTLDGTVEMLLISEVLYDSPLTEDGSNNPNTEEHFGEFISVLNRGTKPVSLDGVSIISKGGNQPVTFGPDDILQGGQTLMVAYADPADMADPDLLDRFMLVTGISGAAGNDPAVVWHFQSSLTLSDRGGAVILAKNGQGGRLQEMVVYQPRGLQANNPHIPEHLLDDPNRQLPLTLQRKCFLSAPVPGVKPNPVSLRQFEVDQLNFPIKVIPPCDLPKAKKRFGLFAGRSVGCKFYELNDHLGNVRAVVTDRKLPNDVTDLSQGFIADLVSYANYYPFGWKQPGRMFSPEDYRFAFNGKETDGEWGTTSNSTYDYGFRIYNGTLGKFLSVDPLVQLYPFYSSYQYAGNSPIKFIDLDGLETVDTSFTSRNAAQKVIDHFEVENEYVQGGINLIFGSVNTLNNSGLLPQVAGGMTAIENISKFESEQATKTVEKAKERFDITTVASSFAKASIGFQHIERGFNIVKNKDYYDAGSAVTEVALFYGFARSLSTSKSADVNPTPVKNTPQGNPTMILEETMTVSYSRIVYPLKRVPKGVVLEVNGKLYKPGQILPADRFLHFGKGKVPDFKSLPALNRASHFTPTNFSPSPILRWGLGITGAGSTFWYYLKKNTEIEENATNKNP